MAGTRNIGITLLPHLESDPDLYHFRYDTSPSKVSLQRGPTTVNWTCWVDSGHGEPGRVEHFAVHFEGASPCEKGWARSQGGVIELNVRDSMVGKFRYFVAVFYEGQVYTDDPEIIVWE